jgi:hypothetical protein
VTDTEIALFLTHSRLSDLTKQAAELARLLGDTPEMHDLTAGITLAAIAVKQMEKVNA